MTSLSARLALSVCIFFLCAARINKVMQCMQQRFIQCRLPVCVSERPGHSPFCGGEKEEEVGGRGRVVMAIVIDKGNRK